MAAGPGNPHTDLRSRRRLTAGPVAVIASCAVVALGIGLVVGGAFPDDGELRLGTASGPTSSSVPPTTATTAAVVTTASTEPTTAPPTTGTPTTLGVAAGVTTIRVTTTKPVLTTTAPPLTVAPTTSPPQTATPPTAPPAGRQSGVESQVLAATNRDRAAAGLGALSRNSCMDEAAARWARHMAQTGTMAHSDESGSLVQGCRGANAYWGDNVGWWDPCSAAEMEQWWMGSPSHRHNIVSADFDVIGIAVVPGVQNFCWFQVLFGS